MSQTETHIGKLRKVDFQNKTKEEWCEMKCREMGITDTSRLWRGWEDKFRDNSNERYFFANGEIWEAFEHHEFDDNDIYELIPHDDGTISFVMQFYNGGTCLSECIEEGLERISKKS